MLNRVNAFVWRDRTAVHIQSSPTVSTWRSTQHGEDYTLSCSEKEFQKLWREYLEFGYGLRRNKKFYRYGRFVFEQSSELWLGIRILKQDLWEMIITFLISQNNNIPRIRNSVRRLCEAAGEKRDTRQGSVYFTFPSPEAVLEAGPEVLGKLGLGTGRSISAGWQKLLQKEV